MSANPLYAPAIPELVNASLQPMQPADLDQVMAIELDAYPFPWSRGNFADSLQSGYHARVLRSPSSGLLGYFLMMFALDEAHLLNITVTPSLHGRGLGRWLLDQASRQAKEAGMTSMLLEVRPSNLRALHVYQRYGFIQIGRRKQYYPAANNSREDAIVMRLAW